MQREMDCPERLCPPFSARPQLRAKKKKEIVGQSKDEQIT
jgi:hypothetical protein